MCLTLSHAILLFLASALGGAMNAVAGGGSFVAFPALLFTGVPPVPANATNTLSLWVGTAVSGGAYRRHLDLPRRILLPLFGTSLVGSLVGALLLIRTPPHTFLRVIPWLMLVATLLFTLGRYVTGRISAGISHQASNAAIASASFFELLVAIYGGYFGGGIGIMNLAMFSALGMTNIHAMNALKVVVVAVINGVAAVTFVATGSIVWPQAVVMIVGAALGGYSAAHYAQKMPQSLVRATVIVLGTGMTIYFFLNAYR
jgi:uncharacterized membrane protein YfcA